MSEAEKKESQKTVVAFISGLLIGGLLVGMFSSSPEEVVAPENEVVGEVTDITETDDNSSVDGGLVADVVAPVVVGEGSVIVADQAAGSTVTLGAVNLPTAEGWVVVREFNEGVSGNILGAARYSAEENLVPTTVELIRGTMAGSTYQVVFFTNSGDTSFDLGQDVQIEGIATTFDAQ